MIRLATSEDFPAIQSLRLALFDLLAVWMPDTYQSVPYRDGYLDQVLADDKQALYVAEHEGYVVGYALGSR